MSKQPPPARGSSLVALRDDQTEFDPAQRAALAQMGLAEASRADLAVFFHYARRTALDPFSRQLYMIGRWDGKERRVKYTMQTSIDGLRIVAQRTGEYLGTTDVEWCGEDGVWRDVWTAPTPPAAARVGVWRRGYPAPVRAVALFSEYVQTYRPKDGGAEQPTGLWAKMPAGQLAKCAEALALRRAFPHDLSGLYAEEELQQQDSSVSAADRLRATVEARRAADPVPVDVQTGEVLAEPAKPTRRRRKTEPEPEPVEAEVVDAEPVDEPVDVEDPPGWPDVASIPNGDEQ